MLRVLPVLSVGLIALALTFGGNPFSVVTETSYVPTTEAGDCLGGNTGCDMCLYPTQDCAGNWYCPVTQLPPVYSCDPPPTEPSCADSGQLGTYPNCYTPSCPEGTQGTYPNCVVIDYTCPAGQLGTYPNCYTPTCADSGQLGTYPYCYTPTCADYGQIGTYPNCYSAPEPTCADYGQLGTYPNCYTPSCADYGQVGTYPNCSAPPPDPTCADYGQIGTYPNCSNPPTCADFGQVGTYPNCTPAPEAGSCPATDAGSLTVSPTRVRADTPTDVTFTYSGSGVESCSLVGPGINAVYPATSCTVASATRTENLTLPSQAVYTLTCGTFSAQAVVNTVPAFQEF